MSPDLGEIILLIRGFVLPNGLAFSHRREHPLRRRLIPLTFRRPQEGAYNPR